jgi:dynein heavy chain, axonemal
MVQDYIRTVRRVMLEVRPLFLPQVVRLSSLLLPGLRHVTWTSGDWKDFIERANAAIKSFDVLVTRVHDIYINRIIYVLSGMQEVCLVTLPGKFLNIHAYILTLYPRRGSRGI